MVTCIYPATVLIDHMEGGSMHRVAPGAHPGESVVHLIEGRPAKWTPRGVPPAKRSWA